MVPRPPRVSDEALQAIRASLPADRFVTSAADCAAYGRDWTKFAEPNPSLVVRPRSTAEIQTVLRVCTEHNVPVVPSAGRTGLAGGAVAAHGEVVLSVDRLDHIEPVDVLGRTVTVGAGAITAAVHDACAVHGLFWPVDLASKGSARIGGNLATNAGGVRVIRYGGARSWVLGVEAVTMSGALLELGGSLEKNNTGYDLKQLLIGSEGTLAIITAATLKLTTRPGAREVALLAVEDAHRALALLASARRHGLVLNAFELFTRVCLDEVVARGRGRDPFATPAKAYVLIEVEPHPAHPLSTWIDEALTLADDGVLAKSEAEAHALWALRENITESLSHRGLVHKCDVAVAVGALPRFLDDVGALFAMEFPHLPLFLFGHVGDGNIHVNVPCPPGRDVDVFRADRTAIDASLGALLQRYRGSVSAEHGIGMLKKSQLHFSRSEAEQALFRSIKQVFDPKGLLNPGKIFDP